MQFYVIYYDTASKFTVIKQEDLEKNIEELKDIVHVEKFDGKIKPLIDIFNKALLMGMVTGNRKYPISLKEKPTIWSLL